MRSNLSELLLREGYPDTIQWTAQRLAWCSCSCLTLSLHMYANLWFLLHVCSAMQQGADADLRLLRWI
jgi:hypothetical protein